jgi:hypothetical protein
MKTSLKIFNLLFAAIMLLNFSCKSDDDSIDEEATLPVLTLSNASYDTTFFSTGQTNAPTINWNGNIGTFSLGSPSLGFSVDENTGVVSWDRSISIGSNEVELIATNANGSDSIIITVQNQFMGDFYGNYNYDPNSTSANNYLEMDFNVDGSMGLIANNTNAIGTWTHSDNIITCVYSYDNNNSFYSMVFTLNHDNTSAQLTGYWSIGETLQDPADGYVYLNPST